MAFQRIRARLQKSHEEMSYSEIEATINRRYEKIFGRKLNWDNPQTYNEKINVSKVYMPTPEKTRLADKVAVREWVAERLGSDYLIPLLGVYDSFDDIDFDVLPDKFVIKCSHDSASFSLIHDKSMLNKRFMKHKYDFFLRRNYAYVDFEMHYKDIYPKILIEAYIDSAALNDYRFYCFDGKPYYCAVDYYSRQHSRNARNIYNMNWELQPFILSYPNYSGQVYRPDNFEGLVNVASKLAYGLDQVRIDLYSAGEKIYFGEMTFAHASGFQKLIPDEWDYKLGSLWPFDNTVRRKILADRTKP